MRHAVKPITTSEPLSLMIFFKEPNESHIFVSSGYSQFVRGVFR
jgi:hypothetical protein